jgi:tellurium resistance protein TerD
MPLNLSKGESLNLTKEVPSLKNVIVGLGWDANTDGGAAFDLDASAFLVQENGKVRGESDVIYYRNLHAKDGSVIHAGDNLTGDGEGDDEQIKVDLSKIASEITKIPFTVTIYQAEQRGQSFGRVNSAYIRLVNADTNEEVARYNLGDGVPSETGAIFGEMVRENGDWQFKAIGQGFAGGLNEAAARYGLN